MTETTRRIRMKVTGERMLQKVKELVHEGNIRRIIIRNEDDRIIMELPLTVGVVGAVLLPGAKAPNLVRREDLKTMMPGSVIVDVAVDQGGCVETIKPTTHEDPIYVVDGVIHYGVANMPGGVPRTSTLALTNATLPWVVKIARHGADKLAALDTHFADAINTNRGTLTNKAVAEAHELEFEPSAAGSCIPFEFGCSVATTDRCCESCRRGLFRFDCAST